MHSKSFPIQNPSLTPYRQIYILTVNKRIIVPLLFHENINYHPTLLAPYSLLLLPPWAGWLVLCVFNAFCVFLFSCFHFVNSFIPAAKSVGGVPTSASAVSPDAAPSFFCSAKYSTSSFNACARSGFQWNAPSCSSK